MSVNKSFVVKNGLEVADNLIFTEGQKVGIGTTTPDYILSVNGDLSITGGIYVPTASSSIGSTTGIASATTLDFISGINTSGLLVGDYVTGTFLQNNTRIVSIGTSSLGITPNHTNAGLTTVTFSFQRYKFSGESGQALVSQGPGLPPIWTVADSVAASTATTAVNVIGGIASVTQLSVSGVSTFNSGIFSGSTSTDLVRITQTGSGNALRVEDNANPDSTSFIIDNDGQVGIKTSQPNYDLDVRGTILFGGPLYLEGGQLTSRVGILSGTDRSIISGIDTTGIDISDFVDDAGTDINPGTVVISVGINSVGILPDHNRFGTPVSTTIDVTRQFYAGLDGEVLVLGILQQLDF